VINIDRKASVRAFFCGGCVVFRKEDRGFEVPGVTSVVPIGIFLESGGARKQFSEPARQALLSRPDWKM